MTPPNAGVTRCLNCEKLETGVHSCFDAALLRKHRAQEQAVIESVRETREFYRDNLGERGHPFPLSDLFSKIADLDAMEKR